jgi:CheY-like chemotaxis protein
MGEIVGLAHILCVEDDPDIRAILELSLGTVGQLQTSLCESGEEALSAVPRLRPDLILLDVMMPGMDGLETLQALRQINEVSTIPIIFMTAKAQRQDIESYMAIGALAVLTKPFDPMTLADEVRRLYASR